MTQPILLTMRLDNKQPISVPAETDDDELFAVHPSVGLHDHHLFTVTHIPTGLSVTTQQETRAQAWEVIAVLRKLPWDWENGDKTYFEFMRKTMTRELQLWVETIKK